MRPTRPSSPSFFPTRPAPATLGCTLGSVTSTILFYPNRIPTFPSSLRGRPRPPHPHLSGLTAHSPSIAPIRPSSHAHLRTARPPPTRTPVPPTTRSSSPRQTTPLRTTSSNNASANVHSDSSCRKWLTGKQRTLRQPPRTSTVTRWAAFFFLHQCHSKTSF